MNNLLEIFTNYEDYPVLENVQGGNTDYIDNIDPEKMTSSLMKGTDNFQRLFIAMKIFPRELYHQMLQEQLKNYQACLSLVTLSSHTYLPLDISRYIQEFLEFRPTIRSTKYTKSQKNISNPQQYLQNQISTHTVFQRYTTRNYGAGPYVHGENSRRCDSLYSYGMLKYLTTLIITSSGKWNIEQGLEDIEYNPKEELQSILNNTHPKAMLFNDNISKMISGVYPLRPNIKNNKKIINKSKLIK